ncbi:MAG: hypothetical protein ACK55I_03985, partial [bacterium]
MRVLARAHDLEREFLAGRLPGAQRARDGVQVHARHAVDLRHALEGAVGRHDAESVGLGHLDERAVDAAPVGTQLLHLEVDPRVG